jgi:hypothetical protein
MTSSAPAAGRPGISLISCALLAHDLGIPIARTEEHA